MDVPPQLSPSLDDGTRWRPRRIPPRYWVAIVLYVAVGAFLIHDWDGFVFEQSVRDFWRGDTPYEVAEKTPYYTFLNADDEHPQWYAYPPLPLLAMSVTFLPELWFDVAPPVERVLLKMPMILGTLMLAVVAGAWARHLGAEEATRIRVERLFLFNPFIVLIGPLWGMTDPALMAFLLFGLLRFDQGRPLQAGFLLGLSILIKPFPIVLALPLVAFYWGRAGWRPIARALATTALTVPAVCLPFVLPNPRAFWTEVVGTHLRREPQGLTLWLVHPFDGLSLETVVAVSVGLLTASILLLSVLASRMRAPTAPLVLVLGSSTAVLLWNRVVNEQYLVMVVAPLLLLYGVDAIRGPLARGITNGVPILLTGVTLIQGFHFITFFPPDVALRLFGAPVDVVASRVGNAFDWGWNIPSYTPAFVCVLALLAAGWVWVRYAASLIEPPLRRGRSRRAWRAALPAHSVTMGVCALILLVGSLPALSPAAVGAPDEETPRPYPTEPRVGAFYYLWWNNPAHDPDMRYGNWMEVSQDPALGFYTQTRGVARLHAQMMRDNGIDVALVSYHTGELERYRTFQEEAAQQGLLVAPLMELNQVYDQDQYRPWNWSQEPERHASYSLTNSTREAIQNYVLELADTFESPSAYRVDGRPVIYFYDAYVSDIGYRLEERLALANALLEIYTLDELRAYFHDPTLQPQPIDLLRWYPPAAPETFYNENNFDNRDQDWPDAPARNISLSVPWREALFHLHREWWGALRAALEEELGPVFLVSGDAWNENAGFYAGIIKDLENLKVFDGSFIYSPSFTWGVQSRALHDDEHFEDIYDLWTHRNLWLTAFANGLGRYSAYGVAPSYDDRIKRPEVGFTIPAVDPDGRSMYERSWESVLAAPPTLTVIATFNEFFEGSSIEPNADAGERWLHETGSYRRLLDRHEPPGPPIVLVVHERQSRLHPWYSEMDKPHFWALKLIAASGQVWPGSQLLAVDGLETEHLDGLPARPGLVIIDGGRDDLMPGDAQDDFGLSADVMERLWAWRNASVPVIIIGREVAPAIRHLVPDSCASGPLVDLGVSVPGEDDDEMNAGTDALRAANGVVYLDRVGFPPNFPVGTRCAAVPNVAFVNLKPWETPAGDLDGERRTAIEWTRPHCLRVLVEAFFPTLLPGGTGGAGCTIPLQPASG